jgi:Zn-dependent peptidase ImmA (M78 family)/DNA-binding XRE family transcriptional regulator
VSKTAAWAARQIRDARIERGLSQADLAKRTGRTQAAVSLWESGKRTLGLDDLLDLSRELQKDLDYFLPPERVRQPIAMLLRATAERIAGSELRDAVDKLLVEVDEQGVPPRTIAISATTPIHAAEELLAKAEITVAPVPVEQLARDCGALVLEAKMSDGLSGLVFEVEDGAVIAINSGHHPNRRRFSIGHELGHYLLGHHDRFHIDVGDSDDPGFDWQVERLANQFAAEILMPRTLVLEHFQLMQDAYVLADRFQVSELAMGYRLVNLGLK